MVLRHLVFLSWEPLTPWDVRIWFSILPTVMRGFKEE
jgi:hypothetical protein